MMISGAKGRGDQLSHFNRRSSIIHNYLFHKELKDSTMLESFVHILHSSNHHDLYIAIKAFFAGCPHFQF